MLEKYIPKRFATAMIKHVIAATLFFPYIYSHNNNVYYQDFVLPNFFAILAMVFIFTSWKLDFKRNAIFVSGLGILLLAYNICATYMNVKYHHWYGEQINTTISFLFFMVLLMVKDIHALIDTATIKATIHMIVASNVCAIGFRLATGLNGIRLINNWISFTKYSRIDLQVQYSWVYGHKSEYGLMLLLCIAFLTINRNFFRNILTYIFSLIILFVALYISDSYTAFGAALLIFVGQFLGYLVTAKWWKKMIVALAFLFPLTYLSYHFLHLLKTTRHILTLNGRTYIWHYFINYIHTHPNGTSEVFGEFLYYISEWGEWGVSISNAHNVFLNHMLRFSIPVGGIFIALCMTIVLFSLIKNLSFTTICIWVALSIPIMMDHSLSSTFLSYVLNLIFIMFFSPKKIVVRENP